MQEEQGLFCKSANPWKLAKLAPRKKTHWAEIAGRRIVCGAQGGGKWWLLTLGQRAKAKECWSWAFVDSWPTRGATK